MALIVGMTRGGTPWTPSFLSSLNSARCIGCGRCYKVCSRDVLELVERETVAASDEDDGFEEDAHMVMVIHNADDCIGCLACARVCPKKCHNHGPQELAA